MPYDSDAGARGERERNSRRMDKSRGIGKAFREKCTHRHILASVSREGLLVLQEDAVTRFPACFAGSFTNAAFGLCKRERGCLMNNPDK